VLPQTTEMVFSIARPVMCPARYSSIISRAMYSCLSFRW